MLVSAAFVQGRVRHVDVAASVEICGAQVVHVASRANANVVLHVLSVARVLIRVVGEQELVCFSSDAEGLCRLLRVS